MQELVWYEVDWQGPYPEVKQMPKSLHIFALLSPEFLHNSHAFPLSLVLII